jgi:hypothetical protein
MRYLPTLCASLLLALLSCAALHAAPPPPHPPPPPPPAPGTAVDLAQLQGWDIIVSPDASPSELYAAREFQTFFNEAAGVELPISNQTDRADQHVFIGSSDALAESELAFSTQNFGDEDFRIVIRDNHIAIAGGRPRGTLYGVYTFLEDYLGIRFLTHDHTHVPKVAPWRAVGPVDRFYHPPLAFRWSAYGETDYDRFTKSGLSFPAFAARLRCNAVNDDEDPQFGGVTDMGLINHTFYHQIPSTEYGAEHPEYYSLVDGVRRAPTEHDAGGIGNQPCLTNPQVLAIVTAAVLDEIEQNPGRQYFTVAQNDNGYYCQCPDCAAVDEEEQSHMGTLLRFVNAVADAVAEEHPDVIIGTLAYQYSRKPPKLTKARPNVRIQLASIECSITKPIDDPSSALNRPFCEELQQWSKICNNISIWSYNTNFAAYLLPCPNLRVIEPNIRFFVTNNINGIFMQGAHDALGAEFSELRNYVTSRLLWDPTENAEQLINEFARLHYGNAAPPIIRFINLLHDHAQAQDIDEDCFGSAADYGIDSMIVEEGLKAFDEALSLAESDIVRQRVEKASVCVYRAAIEDVWVWTLKNQDRLDEVQLDPTLAARTRPYASRLFELCERYRVTEWSHWPFPVHKAEAMLSKAYGLKPDEKPPGSFE